MTDQTLNFLERQKKALAKKHWLAIFLLAGAALFGYLFYFKYYQPSMILADFLPENFDLALAYEKIDFLSSLTLKNLKAEPVFSEIYQNWEKSSLNFKNQFTPDEWQTLEQSQAWLALGQGQDLAALFYFSNKKTAEKLESWQIKGLVKKHLNKRIVAFSTNPGLLEQLTLKNQPLKNSAIKLGAGLTAYLKPSFFKQAYQSDSLTTLQTLLQPLAEGSFILNFDPELKKLQISSTETPPESKTDLLAKIKEALPPDADFLLAAENAQELLNRLERDFPELYQKIYSWLKLQSQSEMDLKTLQGPVALALKGQQWLLITEQAGLPEIEKELKNYFGQFFPAKKTVRLPDQTLATELIADSSQVIWQKSQKDGWEIYKNAGLDLPLGYGLRNGLIVVSNQITNLPALGFQSSCDEPGAEQIFEFKPQNLQLFNYNLGKIAKITAFSDNKSFLTLCLE